MTKLTTFLTALLLFGGVYSTQVRASDTEESLPSNVEAYDDATIGDSEDAVYRRWLCRARNGRGLTFRGVDRFRHQAQREALNHCYRSSARCYIVGCRIIF